MIEDDPHGGWERMLPIWEAKEPAIVAFLKARVALPLFFERALIEITPTRALYWADGDAAAAAETADTRNGGGVMTTTTERANAGPRLDALDGLVRLSGYPHHVRRVRRRRRLPDQRRGRGGDRRATRALATFAAPAGLDGPDRIGRVSLTGSHIRPQPGYGYDERRHVTVWGTVAHGAGRPAPLSADSAWGWDEAEVPFFEYSERSVGQSRRYFDALSAERGTPVRPRLSFGWLALRTTRLPFLSATIVPVVLGIAIAASEGSFDLLTAFLTVLGASFVQLGLNVANDYFDAVQGADDMNVTPTQFSGGSRVIQYGLVSRRRMGLLAAGVLPRRRRDRPGPARAQPVDRRCSSSASSGSSSASPTPRRR